MKKHGIAAALAAMLIFPMFGQTAMCEESTGIVCVEQAVIYADAALTERVADTAFGGEIVYENGDWYLDSATY